MCHQSEISPIWTVGDISRFEPVWTGNRSPTGPALPRSARHNGSYDFQAGDDVPRKGRARRFREARRLKQGYDDGLFREGLGTLADVSEDGDELDDDEFDDEDDDFYDDEEEDWDPDHR